jgi:predicted DNA-binding protein (UPF0251 family)
MTNPEVVIVQVQLMGQAELPPAGLFGEHDVEVDLWFYRKKTVALLHRYARSSVEVGRLPSLLGREFFRSRATSTTMRNFEDVVIFVADMELAIEKLTEIDKKLLAMNVLEEYSTAEIARVMNCSQRTVERLLQNALDELSRILIFCGMLGGGETLSRGQNWDLGVSCSKSGRNKSAKNVGSPPQI